MLERLYVCPCCFKYSKELVVWWEHVRACDRRSQIPGTKIYVHPKGRRTVQAATQSAGTGVGKPGRRKKDEVEPAAAEETVEDQGEWSVWEVDGEKEVVHLSCSPIDMPEC
jgi:hypothetical protein